MTTEPSWPWQPRHNPLPPTLRGVFVVAGLSGAVILAYLVSTYLGGSC